MSSPIRLVPLAALLLLGFIGAHAAPETPVKTKPAEPENAGVSIWTQNVSGFRKEHGSVGGYKKRWDLSDLPHYVPKQPLTGTIRIWGNNYLNDGELGQFW